MAQGVQGTTRRILLVDDEPSIQKMLTHALEREGFQVYTVGDGEAALEAIETYEPHLIILDIMLPKIDGTEVIRRVRWGSDVPVIMLTAKDDEIDRVVGLELGADDYVTKPFAVRELVARVRAIMRRASAITEQRQDELSYDGLKIHLPSRRVAVGGEDVDLTYTEFELLVTLASNPGRVFSRSTLLTRVWGDEFRDERTVDVHIRHLREKIERDPRNPEFIHTARGVGYVFR
ncbi:MAG: response regulator transcription factor [Actinomycetota bacterium]|jgi:DNA-binding response OmpR family regulator|nr:response regulator transcription factor [Rubrobacter sp.]MDQ3924221.1 response regulator transcription factor [Actinomycetota bacterium]MDQ4001223.1 response regulator transcription factor [Actinomycetota bacterium]MDQ4083013.1 response regulator transcription factor [Actinomycetota bacterium]